MFGACGYDLVWDFVIWPGSMGWAVMGGIEIVIDHVWDSWGRVYLGMEFEFQISDWISVAKTKRN